MDKDKVLAFAREAGFIAASAGWADSEWFDRIEHFAALVAAAERNRTWTQEHWTEYERSIAAAEREECAKVCESYIAEGIGREMAEAIRARGRA